MHHFYADTLGKIYSKIITVIIGHMCVCIHILKCIYMYLYHAFIHTQDIYITKCKFTPIGKYILHLGYDTSKREYQIRK